MINTQNVDCVEVFKEKDEEIESGIVCNGQYFDWIDTDIAMVNYNRTHIEKKVGDKTYVAYVD